MSTDVRMTTADCEAVLRRSCFGHLACMREGHADVLPVRYAYLEGWVYFRADRALRNVIAHNPWLVLAVTEFRNDRRVSSVTAQGGCYATAGTGTAVGDAAAMRGIMEVRDRATAAPARKPRIRQSSVVFRLHIDDLSGVTAFVPCPAGGGSPVPFEAQRRREPANPEAPRASP
jgi:nitroimidazol reductase NimA-like FMN-containing flavoprotein (pyridoxamine 5'-phosphate oxidase superfamily)